MSIIPLRESPTVDDIPAMLRNMANMIESGEVSASSALFIVPVPSDWPMVFGWGDHLGDDGNIAVCELTKAWFIRELTSRRS